MDDLSDGELLWGQLMAFEQWSQLKNAFRALTETDLRRIVFARIAHEYDRRREGPMAIQRKTWEYKRLDVPQGHQVHVAERFDDEPRRAGEDGWELVAVDGGTAYLRRQLEVEGKHSA